MKKPIALLLTLVAIAFSGPPALLLHYSYSAGPRGLTNDILVKDSLIFKVGNDGKRVFATCKVARMKPDEIKELMQRIDASRVSPTEDDTNYVCDGHRSVFIWTKRKSIDLWEACKPRKYAEDLAVDSTMDALSNFLAGIVERKNRTCEEGYYFNVIKHDSNSMTADDCSTGNKAISWQEINRNGVKRYLLESMVLPSFPIKLLGDCLGAETLSGRTIHFDRACYEIEVTKQQDGSFKRL